MTLPKQTTPVERYIYVADDSKGSNTQGLEASAWWSPLVEVGKGILKDAANKYL